MNGEPTGIFAHRPEPLAENLSELCTTVRREKADIGFAQDPDADRLVRIYERDPPFMHAKALVVDGAYAMLGSANLDYRSLQLNYELNVEIADSRFVETVLGQIESEIAASRHISAEGHAARSTVRRLTENLCFLFQPML